MSGNTSSGRLDAIKRGDVYLSPPNLVNILKNIVRATVDRKGKE